MPTPSLLQRLKERKLVQWALAYLAGAWVVYEGTGTAFETWDVPVLLVRSIHVLLIVGFFVTLILAWYHGEKGRQQVSGPELLMVATLFVIAGGVFSLLSREPRVVQPDEYPVGEVESVAEALNRLPSLAVLPFANRSGVPDDQYFADGVQDELLTNLQRVRGLRVISRTSSDAYRDSDKTIPEIGRELKVGYVLEGGVQRSGDRVHINVQLVDAVNEGHLWAETYERLLTPENLFDIQTEIVRTVADELNIALRSEEWARAARRSTTDLDAFELYLRGAAHSVGSEEAIALFQEALERDPGFVGAHVGLARSLAYQFQYLGQRSEARAAAAREAAFQAVNLAPESEDAQLVMGIYLYRVEKDYDGALEWLRRASGTLLGDYDYHYFRALTERRMGLYRQSLASFQACQALSPRAWNCWLEAGRTYLVMRRYSEAEAAILEAQRLLGRPTALDLARLAWVRDGTTDAVLAYLESTPASYRTWEVLMFGGRYEDALVVLQDLGETFTGQRYWYPKALLEAETLEVIGRRENAQGKFEDAARTLRPLVEENPDDWRYHASVALAYAGLGMGEDAVREGRSAVEIMPRERDAFDAPYFLFNLAVVHARLGEVDAALGVLDDLLRAPSGFSPNILERHFRLRPIHDDPRFKALMDRERDRVF